MFRYILILYTLLLLAVPITASAQEAPGGTTFMEQGEAAYVAGDYEAAQPMFEKAIPLLTTDPDRAKAHARLAFIYAAFDKTDKAYSEFLESLKLDNSLALDPEVVSPKIYESFKKARDMVVREGSLVCNCDPAGAEVYLDGKLLGEAPVKKERIPEGDYALVLKKPGYETATGSITIKKDVTLTVEDRLVAARGEIMVDTAPPGVRVSLDGRDAGITPVTVERVSGGEHTVLLERDYYEPLEKKLSLTKGEHTSIEAALRRRLLVIPVSEGSGAGGGGGDLRRLIEAAFVNMDTLRLTVSDIGALSAGLKERGLDPASLGFLTQGKTALALEDSAVLSGLMERAGVELALVVRLLPSEGKAGLTLTLYSPASDSGDRTTITADDLSGLKDGLATFIEKWKAQERSTRLGTGADMVDRAGGGVEVIRVLTGSPAFDAGLVPGDLINQLDGAAVAVKSDLSPLTRTETKHTVGFINRGRQKETSLTPAYLPVEAPTDSPDYLYNLDLVDYKGVLDALPSDKLADKLADKPDDRRGLAALNLGNAFLRMGDYNKAIKAYKQALTKAEAGVCTGTALYRLGAAYEGKSLWADAAFAYRRAMMLYPAATLAGADGPYAAPLAKSRMVTLYNMGLVSERWWE